MRSDDFDRLRRGGTRVELPAGQALLVEGAVPDALYLVEAGTLVVRQGGHVVALVAAGELVGELAFLGQHPATASVEAETDAVLWKVGRSSLAGVLADDPDAVARFYRGVAEDLADRLRTTTRSLSRLRGELMDRPLQRHRVPAGRFSRRSEPPGLVAALDDERRRANEAAQDLDAGTLARDGAAEQVTGACDAILSLLAHNLEEGAVLGAGAADPLAFRDSGDLRAGVSGLVLRESFPVLMSSHTLAQCFARPRGYPEDYLTTGMLYEEPPAGDGTVGGLVDAWFKSGTFVRARREARTVLARRLGDAVSAPDRPAICGLGTGAAAELIDAVQAAGGEINVTAIDVDPEALQHASRRLARSENASLTRLIAADVRELADRTDLKLPPQSVVYLSGLAEYLNDDEVAALIAWSRRNLRPDGAVILACLSPDVPDLLLLRDLLGWGITPRSAEQWPELGRRAGIESPPQVELHDGWHLIVFDGARPE